MNEKPNKLRPKRQQKFIEFMARPDIESQTQAYMKAYNCNYDTARVNASKLLTNANIRTAIEERRKRALEAAGVTAEEVIGSAAFQMRSSIADVLNETGSFDIEKARRTGAIDLIKKIKVKETIDSKTGDKEVTHEIEMLTNQDARKELANYIRLEKPVNPAPVNVLVGLAVEWTKGYINELPRESILEILEESFPEVDAAEVLKSVECGE